VVTIRSGWSGLVEIPSGERHCRRPKIIVARIALHGSHVRSHGATDEYRGWGMRYDLTGVTYAQTRRADPRIAEVIDRAIGDRGVVANIGAGTGSYEPALTVVAIEPSRVMLNQRAAGSAPAIQATADALPNPHRRRRRRIGGADRSPLERPCRRYR
jgi:hypothetical protein